jgi:hypothetical protein
MNKTDISLLKEAVQRACFDWQDECNSGNARQLAGSPKNTSKGREKSRRIKKIFNRIVRKNIFSTKTLTDKEMDLLHEIECCRPGFFREAQTLRLIDKPDAKKLIKLGLLELIKENKFSPDKDKLMTTKKGVKVLHGDGTYE